MRPYSPGKPIDEVKRELGLEDVVKLASNENPLGPPAAALEAIAREARELNLYPDASGHHLKAALSERLGLPPTQIALGNGSDEIIHYLGLVFLHDEDDELLVGDPSFVRYDAAAGVAGCRLVKVPLDADLRHDLPAMAGAITGRTRLAFIANPNNPTGTIVRLPEVERFLEALPEGVPLVIDEAYFEYARAESGYPSALELLKAGRPVVGMRTFSKAHGLAGIRLGYAFGPEEVIDAVERVRAPFNVNSLAQAAAIAALGDGEHIRRTVENNRTQMARADAALHAMGLRTTESCANFICVDVGRPARPVFEALLRQGVIVRPGDVLGLPTWLRVSVGTPSEVDRFLAALAAIVAVPA